MSTELLSSPVVARPREFAVDALQVRVYGDQALLAKDAAASAAAHLQATLASRGQAAVILATGNSQWLFLEQIINGHKLDWSAVTFFHLDEYLGLPGNHPAGFRHYLSARVERRIKAAAFHYLDGDALEPVTECDRYAALIKSQPIDLCLLGVGENGHLAFNDPPVADFNDPRAVKLVKLDERARLQQVKQGHFPAMEAVPQYALTLTISTICSARKIVCLATETRKADIIKEMLQSPIRTACPASVLRRQPQATLFLDEDAARLL